MQEILNQFGVQWILLLAQVVNFLIVLYILKRFALKPILQVLKERQSTIAESIKNADKARIALETASEKEKEILQRAQENAKVNIEDAKKQAQEIATESEANAKEQVSRMIEDAHKKIEQQTQDAERQLASKITNIASQMLKKSLVGILDEKDQEEVVSKATKRLRA